MATAGTLLFEERARTLERVGGYFTTAVTMSAGGGAERARAVYRFGRDPGVAGRSLEVEGSLWEIVGVLAEGVRLPEGSVDLWTPFRIDPAAPAENSHSVTLVARRAPGANLAEVRDELDGLTGELPELFPRAHSRRWMEEAEFRTRARARYELVVGAEVRRALGASGRDLFRYFLVESLTLAGVAGAAGLALGHLGIRALVAAAPSGLPRLDAVASDGSTVALSVAMAATLGLALGGQPVLPFRRQMPRAALVEGGSGAAGGSGRGRARNALVVAQIALALVLLAASGLMVRSFARLIRLDPGFDTGGILALDVALPTRRRSFPWCRPRALDGSRLRRRALGNP